MAVPWIKQILGSEKRTHHRWVSGHLDKGEKRKREEEIAQQITTFREAMDRQGIVFREDRDAWEAYWKKHPRAHLELVGASVDEVLGEKAREVFERFWRKAKKPSIVRFEGDGIVPNAPAILTLGAGATRFRANPLDALKSTDPDERARAVVRIDSAIERCDTVIEGGKRRRSYLEKVRHGLQTGAMAIETNGEVLVQGLLTAPEVEEVMEVLDDDDTE